MARRKKGSGKAKASQISEKIHTILPDENTSGSGSTESGSIEDQSDETSVVHHKKFGEIRVQQEDVPLLALPPIENIRVPVIVNGCLPQSSLSLDYHLSDRPLILPPLKKLPLDGSVIIKPGCFQSEPICEPTYYQPISNLSKSMNEVKDMDVLEPEVDVTPQTTPIIPRLDIPVPLEPLPANIALPPHPSLVLDPQLLSSLSIANDDNLSSSPVIENGEVVNDDMSQSPIVEDKKDPMLVPPVPETNTIRRSTRIRSIGILKKKERSHNSSPDHEKPVKVKSRWRRSSEMEMHTGVVCDGLATPPELVHQPETQDELNERLAREQKDMAEGLGLFSPITENEYKTARNACKEAKRMTCDCILTKEEIDDGEYGCGDDCLNRMLFLECGDQCALGERCSNKCFQKKMNAACSIFKTQKKGFGLKAIKAIPRNTFIMEYVGEVVNQQEFSRRVKSYANDDVKHFYFMSLKGDTVIDATNRGNISRFINHSCDPNAETQKWTINGELRIGFFSRRPIQATEEITFDYQFQRYGKEAQKCYCESANCRGWIGESADDESDDSDDESDDEDEDEDDTEQVDTPGAHETKEDLETKVADKFKDDSDMDLDSDFDTQPEPAVPKIKKKRGRKPKPFSERKGGRRHRRRESIEPVVQDIALEEEIQRLTITGVKNCAHTLMLCRLMVRADDWPTRYRLLQLISMADTPCRKLFLDYHGLRFLHAWMVSADAWSERLEILKTLQTLPISNRRMLIDSKVLAVVETWSGRKGTFSVASTFSPSGDSATSDEIKSETQLELADSDSPVPDSASSQNTPNTNDLSDDLHKIAAKSLMVTLLESWSMIKEEFRIPKKERVQQMKVHQREADLEYHRSTPFGEKLNQLNKIKLVKSNEPRDRDKDKVPKDGEQNRGQESPSTTYPDWFRNHRGRKMTQERRQLYALKVLREEEAARHRMQQEELWNQHKARCTALGLDPNQHPAMCLSGCPVYFDHATRTWSQTPPHQKYQYPQQYPAGYPSIVPPAPPPMMSPAPNALPYPMLSYVSSPAPYPPPMHMPRMYQDMLPQFPQPPNVITLTPEQSIPPVVPTEVTPAPEAEEWPPDAPVVSTVPFNSPMKLPPKWKAAKDPRGFVYYYHIKERKSRWEPPSWSEEDALKEALRVVATEVVDESSSESSETESEEEELDEVDDEVMPLEDNAVKQDDELAASKPPEVDLGDEAADVEGEATIKTDPDPGSNTPMADDDTELTESPPEQASLIDKVEIKAEPTTMPLSADVPSVRPAAKPTKRREGLVQEHIISPRSESNRVDSKKYKETKLKLKRRKEEKRAALKAKAKAGSKEGKKRSVSSESTTGKKIKENFKLSISGAIISHLNTYRRTDCKIGRITSSDDFKHLARKLTHFVMVKELKHCQRVEDLECNNSVKSKARDFVKKYMAKYGAEYERQD